MLLINTLLPHAIQIIIWIQITKNSKRILTKTAWLRQFFTWYFSYIIFLSYYDGNNWGWIVKNVFSMWIIVKGRRQRILNVATYLWAWINVVKSKARIKSNQKCKFQYVLDALKKLTILWRQWWSKIFARSFLSRLIKTLVLLRRKTLEGFVEVKRVFTSFSTSVNGISDPGV